MRLNKTQRVILIVYFLLLTMTVMYVPNAKTETFEPDPSKAVFARKMIWSVSAFDIQPYQNERMTVQTESRRNLVFMAVLTFLAACALFHARGTAKDKMVSRRQSIFR